MQLLATMKLVLVLSAVLFFLVKNNPFGAIIWKTVVLDEVIWCNTNDNYCPQGFNCISWEDSCRVPPCKLFQICFPDPEVEFMIHVCMEIGCHRESCFMRQTHNCTDAPCDVSPDCMTQEEFGHPSDPCHGYICPNGYTCLASHGYGGSQNNTVYISCFEKNNQKQIDIRDEVIRYYLLHSRRHGKSVFPPVGRYPPR